MSNVYQPLSNIQVNVTVIFILTCVVSFHCLGICIHIIIIYTQKESSCDRSIMQFIHLSILTSFSLSPVAG